MTPARALPVAAPRPAPGKPASRTAAALRALVVGLLVCVTLAFDPRDGHVGAYPKYALLVLGGVAAAMLVAVDAFGGRRPLAANWLRWPVAALVAWTAVAAVASDHRGTVLSGFPGSYDGLWSAVALALVFLATAAAFDVPSARRATTVVWFGVVTAVLAFGLAQLADRLVAPGRGWDWARPSIAPWTIGSTLGNPNHLASFLAVLLPTGVVVAVLGDRRTRMASAAVGVVLVAELGITASRGGLAATVAGLAVSGMLLRADVRDRRAAVAGVVVGAVALALAAALALGAVGASKRDIGAVARSGPGTTVDLRLEVWGSALRMAADHPVVGVGPDVFPVVFPAYASDRFMILFGPFTVANGAHNVFLNTLADLGAGGLVAFLAVLVTAAVGIARAWRRTGHDDRDRRLLLAGTAGGLVAYLVQAAFNTQTLPLSLCFWVLLGLAVAVSRRPEDVRLPAGE